jgi:hypothetical protein
MSQDLPPDEGRVLSRLKDFQRATADYVFRRFYEDNPPANRFLVADEVGLGKTVVARGLLVRALNHLWNQVERIDIIYVCSNLAIASQNVKKLKEGLGIGRVPPLDRLTLLPSSIRDLKKNKVNFVAFTPATSFEFQSSLGAARERVLLYRMLTQIWGSTGTGAMNMLQGGVLDYSEWRTRLSESQYEPLEPTILELFHQELGLQPNLKSEFERLSSEFRYPSNNRPAEAKAGRNKLIGELRHSLATCCLHALQPDVIIFDEFQRFKELLSPDTQSGELASQLINYSDEVSRAKVLLLSATPYRLLTTDANLDVDGHYSDFLKTIEFLDRDRVPVVTRLMHDYRLAIQSITDPTSPTERIQEIKGEIQQELRAVMARTERLAASSGRIGMLREIAVEVVPEAVDLRGYLGLQSVSKAVGQGGSLTYWKTAPYALSFMDDYKLKKRVEEAIDRGDPALGRLPECGWIAESDIKAYARVDPRNARLRELLARTVDAKAWQLLWIPPSAAYYRLEGAYADPLLKSYTKRLIFSGWRVVPKAVSMLLSYEAERSALLAVDQEAVYTTSSDRDGALLRFATTDGRHTGLPIFTLLYPSDVLADLIDPVALGKPAIGQTDLASVAELLVRAKSLIDPLLSKLTDQQRLERPDERWYWAAPMLMDRIHAPSNSRRWWNNPKLSAEWISGDPSEQSADDSTSWKSHVQMARQVAEGNEALGQMPPDLLEVLATIALAAPATAALRAFSKLADQIPEGSVMAVRTAAASVGSAFRTMFNLPDVQAVVRSTADAKLPYWRQVLQHCVIGGLPAVMDEYVHVLRDQVASPDEKLDDAVTDVAATMRSALQLRTPTLSVDQLNPDGRLSSFQIRTRFARALTDVTLDGNQVQTTTQVRTAFNSPFWPFVLVSTSIGQEGLDFHQYCHTVVHWDLPSNPVDLEQREGRIHRYKGHAVRKNVASRNSLSLYHPGSSDPWERLFDAAVAESRDSSEMAPYWAYLDGPDGAFIERHVLSYALSRDVARLRRVKDSLVIYRLAFGQPHQQDLLDFLTATHTPQSAKRLADLLRIDLSPVTNHANGVVQVPSVASAPGVAVTAD